MSATNTNAATVKENLTTDSDKNYYRQQQDAVPRAVDAGVGMVVTQSGGKT